MELIENYSPTIIEILRSLYFSETPQTSGELQQTLEKRGIFLDPRTIRYHLSNLEELELLTRIGKKGALLTKEGIEEAKGLLVFDRVGLPSLETEKILMETDFNPLTRKGRLIVNLILLNEEDLVLALEELVLLSEKSVIVSPLIGLVREGERLWNCSVPKGNIGILCISSVNYDAVFQKAGIQLETTATGLYRMKNGQPRGFTELISHHGTTLSPGELLIKGGYTSISDYIETGSGYLTAGIKTFPSFLYDKVISLIDQYCEKNIFNDVAEKNSVMSPLFSMSARDRNRGYFIVFGGANYFGSLIEKGITKNLKISSCLYPVEKMARPSEIIDRL